jgi:hypothetical protein
MDLIKDIYKNREYTNFTTLFDNIISNSSTDPNINYEFELRLVDSSLHTPIDFYCSFIKQPKLTLEKTEDFVVVTYKPKLPIHNIIYRSFIEINDSNNPNISNESEPYLYETKETLCRVTPNNFNVYPISPTIKYALEKRVSKFDLPIHNLQRRIRASFKHSELPFKFDFTIRYQSTKKTIEEQFEAINQLKLNESDIFTPNLKNGFTMICDLEAEYIKEDYKNIKHDFNMFLNEIFTNSNLLNINDKYKFNPTYQEISNIYPLDKSPQVSVLTNSIIQTVDKKEFVWLEKTDGVRYLLIMYKNKIYSFSNIDKLIEIPFEYTSNIDKLTIFDSELYEVDESTKIFKIFDVVMIEEQNITELNFKERMDKFNSVKSKFKCNNITIKQYYELESWKTIIDFVNNNPISPISNDRIDGVIIQYINKPYNDPKPISYKLKPYRLNTIDFRLMWVKPEQRYYLYLIGKSVELIYNLRLLPRISKISEEFFGYNNKQLENKKQYNILFESPFANNMFWFKPRDKFDVDGYTTHQINDATEIMTDMLTKPKKYHDKIVEMSWANDGWIPLRLRFDKEYPNSYRVGISNAALLFSPPTPNTDVYFTREKLAFDKHLIDTFHSANRAIRTFIFDKFINNNQENDSYLLKNYNTCVDLAGGRGGDLIHLFNAGCNTIFAIDADKEALVTYSQKAAMVQNKNIPHVLSVIDKNLSAKLTFNAVYGLLCSDNQLIRRDLYSRREFKLGGVDLVVMNYALHYICNRYPSLIELRQDMKKMLTNDGIVIMSFYDGDSILNQIKNGNNKFAEFTIKEYKPKLDTNDISYYDLDENIKQLITETQLAQLVEILDINSKSILNHEPISFENNLNYIIFNRDTYRIHFKRYYTDADKILLTSMVDSVFNNTYSFNPWAMMPLPTISASGYREEPLVLNKYLDIFKDDFDIIETIYPLQNQTLLNYMCKNNIDNYLNEYLQNIKTIVLKRKI